VDTTRDIVHCGACGSACDSSQFCDGTACQMAIWDNVCANPKSILLKDHLDADESTANDLQVALTSLCTAPGYQAQEVYPEDAGVIDNDTGRPLVRGGELLIAPGGSFRQKLVAFLESNGYTNPYDQSTVTEITLATRDAGVIVDQPSSTVSDTHDFFIVELVREPTRGSLSLVVYGYYGTGTEAGGVFLTQQILASPSSFPNHWYIVEWTDNGAPPGPDPTDTFTIRASGD
jgi:hypothetical protein